MPTTVMEMSTDQDIIDTLLDPAWNPIAGRYGWIEVSQMGLDIAAAPTIVVVAHGNGNAIGNADPGTVDISPESFLVLVQGNMVAGTVPAAIYISTCGPGIAQFAAGVSIAAQNNQIWNATRIFGHSDPVVGPVPPPNAMSWFEIFGT